MFLHEFKQFTTLFIIHKANQTQKVREIKSKLLLRPCILIVDLYGGGLHGCLSFCNSGRTGLVLALSPLQALVYGADRAGLQKLGHWERVPEWGCSGRGAGAARGARGAAQPARAPQPATSRSVIVRPTSRSYVLTPTGVVATSFVVRVPVKRTVYSDPWSVGAVQSDSVFLAIQHKSVSLTSITVCAVWRVPRSCLTAVRLPAREGGSYLPGGMSPVHHSTRTHRWSQGWFTSPHWHHGTRHASCTVASCSHDTTPRPRSHSIYTLFWSHSNNLTFILAYSCSTLWNVHLPTSVLLFTVYIINEELTALFSLINILLDSNWA